MIKSNKIIAKILGFIDKGVWKQSNIKANKTIKHQDMIISLMESEIRLQKTCIKILRDRLDDKY